jgi:hypothetical protein
VIVIFLLFVFVYNWMLLRRQNSLQIRDGQLWS